MSEPPQLLRNDTESDHHWIGLKLAGAKSNRDGIGARVTFAPRQTAEVRSGGSYLSHNDFRIHFGLGKSAKAGPVEVRWPSGLVETFSELEADRYHTLEEGNGAAKK